MGARRGAAEAASDDEAQEEHVARARFEVDSQLAEEEGGEKGEVEWMQQVRIHHLLHLCFIICSSHGWQERRVRIMQDRADTSNAALVCLSLALASRQPTIERSQNHKTVSTFASMFSGRRGKPVRKYLLLDGRF